MANKNDLRFVKTEKLIEETYLKLKKSSDRPVKVNALCREAMINTSTFYSHYDTIEELHNHICEKEINKILDNYETIDQLLDNIESAVRTFMENAETTDALFGGNDASQINMIEHCLLTKFLKGNESPKRELELIFAIGGAAHILARNQSAERIRITVELMNKILNN